MGRVAGDEDATRVIGVRHRDPEVPEADMLQLEGDLRADRGAQQSGAVQRLARRAHRDRRVEEEGRAEVDAAEEAPVALQLRVEDAEEGLAGEALQQPMQLGRAEDEERHQSIMVRPGLADARSLAHQRTASVGADGVGCADLADLARLRADVDRDAVLVLAQVGGGPAVERLHGGKRGGAGAQHSLRRILRQALVVREVEGPHQLALHPVVAMLAEQRAVGRHAADAVFGRDGAGRPERLLDAPEVEMLHRALREVLAARDRGRRLAPLHHEATAAAQAEPDGDGEPDGASADDDDVVIRQ